LAKIKVLDFGLSKKFVPGTRGIMHEWGGTVYTMSPQVLNGTYNFKADIWSIGVMAFLLLADEKPFKGKNKQDVMQNIKKVNYNFKAHEWDSISQDAKDFVSSLLVYDADDRPTANEALQHPWLLAKANSNSRRSSSSSMQNKLGGTRRNSHELMKDVNDCIMAYKSCSEMKKIAAVIIAHKSSAAEILEIRQAFDKYDRTKDGQISMEEFKLALAEFNYSDDELNDMFSKMVRKCITFCYIKNGGVFIPFFTVDYLI
jgi:serine/threonine protein kinase